MTVSARRPDTVLFVPAGKGLPTESWWVGIARQDWRDRVRREQARMNTSKLGRISHIVMQKMEQG